MPLKGFADEHGQSAYRLCNASGNFGFGHTISPQAGRYDTCAVFPHSPLEAPLPGFTLVVSAMREPTLPASPDASEKTLATLTDMLWRNADKSACLYGTRLIMRHGDHADYQPDTPGTQLLHVQDITRGGFKDQPVDIAYSPQPSIAKPLYRAGRSFSSVQYRAKHEDAASGYLTLPALVSHPTPAIVGLADDDSGKVPSLAEQSAAVDSNWVTFTTYLTAARQGKKINAVSGLFYIKSTCPAEPLEAKAGAIRLRQTMPPFMELSMPGFVPAGGHVDTP